MDILDSNTHQNLIPTRSAGADIVLSEADAIRATACRPRICRLESAHHARNRGLKDIALCSIMWDAMLRRSEAAGLGAGYSGHSPRVGAVQALAAANISLAAIMEHGRWQSSMMPARYTRHASAAQSAMARLYAQGS